jgi:hypothetical protein
MFVAGTMGTWGLWKLSWGLGQVRIAGELLGIMICL